ncbi:polysaccharide biosynthesis protein [Aestuariibaculum sediminum]|uniref:Polysaccharide biosynthesis protein n=1 Tax=Aestuariibaculum sediminum TaxID=2770637 RepID=A0A8J6PZC4_9FLAO|nr:polysaccharide biosynthesis protein [Aestuariibaculum sediminum]MBD0831938.1 polysaccharide biosynthesis protein [Aestuariibaculum sediminum]
MNTSVAHCINELISRTNLFPHNINAYNPQKIIDFSEETILITGAAGTIGSELSRQLSNCKFKKLLLVDFSESGVYNLYTELINSNAEKIELIVSNITNSDSIQYIFNKHKPTIVYHCAAYKHVPLMEMQPYEAIKTNILATKQLVDFSKLHRIKEFIFISSDKAVDPINVMGMTKRICELYINHTLYEGNTAYKIFRFGNILGSSGSVIPVLLRQLELNKSLKITHKNMTRFFIGDKKACQLILSNTFKKSIDNTTLWLDCGEPVSILKLANAILEISNNHDVDIEFSGVRSGEKINESMVSENEIMKSTDIPEVFQIETQKKPAKFLADFNDIISITPYTTVKDVKNILRRFIY